MFIANRKSALLRLVITIAVSVTVLSALSVFMIYQTVKVQSEQQLMAVLESDLKGFADLYAQRRVIAVREGMERRIAAGTSSSDHIFLLLDKAGKRLGGNIEAIPSALSERDKWLDFDFVPEGQSSVHFRGSSTLLPGGFALMNARSRAGHDTLLSKVRWTGIGAVVLIALLSCFVGFYIARPLLRRIDQLNDLCADVERGQLDARAPTTDQGDEISVLSININHMLDRVQDLNRATLSLADHIAHELRTPFNRLMVTVNALRVDVQKDGKIDPQFIKVLEPHIAAIDREVTQTVSIFEALLDITTTEADAKSTAGFQIVDMNIIVREVVELYEPVADEKYITLTSRFAAQADVLGDATLLSRMVANLLDNAVKFTPRGGQISVIVERAPIGALLIIEDNGPGIPSGLDDEIFKRFTRSATTEATPGFGLGLPLVKAIAVRHGIKIKLPTVRSGFRVEILFPDIVQSHSTG